MKREKASNTPSGGKKKVEFGHEHGDADALRIKPVANETME